MTQIDLSLDMDINIVNTKIFQYSDAYMYEATAKQQLKLF